MKRMIVAMLGAVLISAVGIYASDKPAAGTVFHGCLVPGASPDTFSLVNATEKGQKGKEKVNFKVVPESAKVKVSGHVTQEVEITGTTSGSGSSAVFTVTKIKRRSDYCG